jgi:hypothetical protein
LSGALIRTGPNNGRRIAVLTALALSIGLAATIARILLGNDLQTIISPSLPLLQPAPRAYAIAGSVTTEELGSRPISVTFTDRHTVMQVTASVKNNHYEIELPSREHAFEIEVVWNSVPGS